LYVLRHGLRWRDLPRQLGYGSGSTCSRRLRHWQALGIWRRVPQGVLNWLGDLDALDWSRASLDSISIRAKRGGEQVGPNPTDRGKAGSKYHVLVDRSVSPSGCWSCSSPSPSLTIAAVKTMTMTMAMNMTTLFTITMKNSCTCCAG